MAGSTPRPDQESAVRHDDPLPVVPEAISHHGAGAARAKVALGASEEQVNRHSLFHSG